MQPAIQFILQLLQVKLCHFLKYIENFELKDDSVTSEF